MIIKVLFKNCEEHTMLFGNSYKSWKLQYSEYVRGWENRECSKCKRGLTTKVGTKFICYWCGHSWEEMTNHNNKEREERFDKKFSFPKSKTSGKPDISIHGNVRYINKLFGNPKPSRIKSFISAELQTQRQSLCEELRNRDAYKIPFSDSEIEVTLIPTVRMGMRKANEWYEKGRDDENQVLIEKIKDK